MNMNMNSVKTSGIFLTFLFVLYAEHPFKDVKFHCMGELPADAIGSTESDGKVWILAYDSQKPKYYTAVSAHHCIS